MLRVVRAGGFAPLCVAAVLATLAPQQNTDARLRWVPNPRATYSWVADPSGHLRAGTVAAIDSAISQLERETTVEIAVVVIDSLDGLEPFDAALLLHRRWGVGKRARDNGIVFLWSPALRKTYVSVGRGLEGVIPDAVAGRIQDEWVIPAFRRGDFDGGMLSGVRALGSVARNEKFAGPPRVPLNAAPAGTSASDSPPGLTWRSVVQPKQITVNGTVYTKETLNPVVYYAIAALGVLMLFVGSMPFLLLAIPVVVVVWLVGRAARRRFPRRCPNGHGWLRRLSETEDDALLSREQVIEEQVKSVDYDVWVCGDCDYRQVIPRRNIWTKYKECPHCHRKTLETDSTVTTAATYSSEGRRTIRRQCKNCEFHDSRSEVIPVLTYSSSGGSDGSSSGGGSSGGGSFGGGSSGGGGSGRSY